MSARTQESLAAGQFGARAAAYLTSAVHAAGADLAALAALAAGRRAARALDLGCGGGHVAYAVAPETAEVVAYDLSGEMLAVVDRTATERGIANLRTVQGPAERLPFPDASFDLVLSRYSAHHWRDFDAGLREAARVLRPDGLAGFVDTVTPGRAVLDTFLQTVELLRDTSHVRNRTRAEWEEALARAGFTVGAVTPFRIRLIFDDWVARMRTPPLLVSAIRAVQDAVADDVRRHFDVAADGSFTLDVAMFTATRAL
jgi:SAM-dependent methyltransferase